MFVIMGQCMFKHILSRKRMKLVVRAILNAWCEYCFVLIEVENSLVLLHFLFKHTIIKQ